MKIAGYELKVVHKKELILTMEDDVDSEELLKIFLETQVKEEKEQNELLTNYYIFCLLKNTLRCLVNKIGYLITEH